MLLFGVYKSIFRDDIVNHIQNNITTELDREYRFRFMENQNNIFYNSSKLINKYIPNRENSYTKKEYLFSKELTNRILDMSLIKPTDEDSTLLLINFTIDVLNCGIIDNIQLGLTKTYDDKRLLEIATNIANTAELKLYGGKNLLNNMQTDISLTPKERLTKYLTNVLEFAFNEFEKEDIYQYVIEPLRIKFFKGKPVLYTNMVWNTIC